MSVDQPAIREETLEFIWANTKDATEKQLRQATDFDGKAFQTVGVATALMAVAGIVVGQLSGRGLPVLAPLLIAGIAYLSCSLFAIKGIMPKSFRGSSYADQLWPEHWQDTVPAIKHAMVDDIAEACRHNSGVLEAKARDMQRSLTLLVIETAAIGAAILIAVWA